MEENNQKNTRIFYITMAIVLAVVTILIIATVAARKNVPAPDGPNSDDWTSILPESHGKRWRSLSFLRFLPLPTTAPQKSPQD